MAEEIELHELIGLPVKVVLASSQNIIGLSGTVVDETKNTLVVGTARGEKSVPKASCTFEFAFRGKHVRVEGSRICFRPEDRPKKVKRE